MKDDELVKAWIDKAEGDFETVIDLCKTKRKKQLYIIAFHCQQCIEKYLKALLTNNRITFPKQHDLEALLALLLEIDPLLGPIRKGLSELTPFAVEFRYPGDDITAQEVKIAVKTTKSIRAILRKRLGLK